MRLLLLRIASQNAGAKHARQSKLSQLPAHPFAIAATNQPKFVPLIQLRQHPPRSRHQFRRMLRVVRPPDPIRLVPARLREFLPRDKPYTSRENSDAPTPEAPQSHTHHTKHRKVSLGVRMVGIEKRAVPIKTAHREARARESSPPE